MEKKKNPKLNQWTKYGLLPNLSLCLSALLVIFAFEWKSPYHDITIDFEAEEINFLFEENEVVEMPVKSPPKPKIDVPKQMNLVSEKEDLKVEQKKEDFDPNELEDLLNQFNPAGESADSYEDYQIYAASFYGGLEAFYEYIRKNLKYPTRLREQGISGRVILSYLIDEEGYITDISVLKSLHKDLDAEAIRVLENSPKWIPAQRAGKNVKTRMQIPIYFELGH